MAMAAMIKMIATTIRSSMRENPFCGPFIETLSGNMFSFHIRQTESSLLVPRSILRATPAGSSKSVYSQIRLAKTMQGTEGGEITLARTVRSGPSKKTGRKRKPPPRVQKLVCELVAENSHNRGATSRSRGDRGTRGVKPKHARLVRAEGALAGRPYRVWMALYFKAVIHGAY